MLTKILNGLILFFVIGIFTLMLINATTVDTPAPVAKFNDYNYCQNRVERPRTQTVWGEISTGYDCMD